MCGHFRACCFVLLLSVVILVIRAENQTDSPTKTEPDNEAVLKKWTEMEDNMLLQIGQGLDKVLVEFRKHESLLNLSVSCIQSLDRFFIDAKKLKIWSVQMMDAIGKPGGGNMRALGVIGSQEECINITVPESQYDPEDNTSMANPMFKGQYCSVDFRPPLSKQPDHFISLKKIHPALQNYTAKTQIMGEFVKNVGNAYDLPFRWGICLPSLCGEDDIQQIVDLAMKSIPGTITISQCDTLHDVILSYSQIAIIVILVSFVIFVIVATILDHFSTDPTESHKEKKLLEMRENIGYQPGMGLIRSMSLIRNLSHLFSSKPHKDKTLGAFQGIRFLTLSWVIMCNVCIVMDPYLIRSMVEFRQFHEKLWAQFIQNGLITVDIFFFMTSTILAYTVVKGIDSSTFKFNPNKLALKRFLRLVPGAMLMIGIVLLVADFGAGPSWTEYYSHAVRICSKNWWHTLTLGDNLSKADEMCLPHLWYISADFQMFGLGMLYLILFYKKRVVAYILLLTYLTSSVVTTGILAFINEYPPVINGYYVNYKLSLDFFRTLHTLPFNHFGVYAIGLATGTLLARTRSLRVSLVLKIVGWTVALFLGISSVFVSYFYENGREASAIEGAAYHSLYRLAFVTSLSWLVIMCSTGNAVVLNKILSWRAFVTMNKPSYSMYLSHYLVLQFFFRSMQGPTDFDPFFMIFLYACNLMATYCFAGLVEIFFLAPFSNLIKMWLGSDHIQKTESRIDIGSLGTQEDLSPGNVTVINMNKIDLESAEMIENKENMIENKENTIENKEKMAEANKITDANAINDTALNSTETNNGELKVDKTD